MNIYYLFFAALSMLTVTGYASSGTIQFTGAIAEQACVTEVLPGRTLVLCSRAASVRALQLDASSKVAVSPWDLAVITQISTPQRRDIVITYR
ncbi:MAG: hypothetical protein ABS943_22240 [Pantoea agglomerans]